MPVLSLAPVNYISRRETDLVTRSTRQVLENLIEAAIDFLDMLDGDTELELNGDKFDTDNAEYTFRYGASTLNRFS